VTFAFHASKALGPAPGGYFNFQWQMYQDSGVGFFGEKTRNFSFSDTGWSCQMAAAESASFVSQTVPSTMVAGQIYGVSVKMYNAGTTTWTTAGNYKLGSQFPDNNTTWGLSRKSLPSSIAPNTDVTFNFNVTAPSTPGTYYFQWMMVQDGGTGWFGSASPLATISVTPPPPAAPSNLFAFTPAPGATEIAMTWSDNSNNEDGFKIEQQNGNSGWVQIATVGPNVTSYTATGLQLDQQYCYRIRAYNASGNSAYSNQVCKNTSSGGD
jgi:Fibronectin type III domain/Ig-like domain from next to BRCA1 gene